MTHLNSDKTVAVSDKDEWHHLDTCPRGVKVLLLGQGGVACIGRYDGKDTFWLGWFPIPKKPDWMRK